MVQGRPSYHRPHDEEDSEEDQVQDLINVARQGLAATSPSTASSQPRYKGPTKAHAPGVDATWLDRIAREILKLQKSTIESGQDVAKLRAQLAMVEGNCAKQTATLEALHNSVVQNMKDVKTEDSRAGEVAGQSNHQTGANVGNKSQDLLRSQSTSRRRFNTNTPSFNDDDGNILAGGDDDEMQIDTLESSTGTLRAQEPSQERRNGQQSMPARATSTKSRPTSAGSKGPRSAPQETDLEETVCVSGPSAQRDTSARALQMAGFQAEAEKAQPQHVRKPQVARRSQKDAGRTRSLQSSRPTKSSSADGHLGPAPRLGTPLGLASSITVNRRTPTTSNGDQRSNGTPPLTQEQESAFSSIKETIACLPRPKRMKLPEKTVTFAPDFLRTAVGGNAATFATVSDNMVGKQTIPCEELIKVNPDAHEHAPRTGYHGALTFVHGYPYAGELGKKLPLFWKNGSSWEYGGVYSVAKRMVVPVSIWETWDADVKLGHASKLLNTGWGMDLLSEKGIVASPDDGDSISTETVLDYFEKRDEPCLRMCWTILQCVGFERIQYDLLAEEMKRWRGVRSESEMSMPSQQSPVRKRGQKAVAQPSPRDRGTPKAAIGSSQARPTRPSIVRTVSPPLTSSPRKRLTRPSTESHASASTPRGNAKRARLTNSQLRESSSEKEMSDSIVVQTKQEQQHGTPGRERQAKRKSVDYRIKQPELDDLIFGNGQDESEGNGSGESGLRGEEEEIEEIIA